MKSICLPFSFVERAEQNDPVRGWYQLVPIDKSPMAFYYAAFGVHRPIIQGNEENSPRAQEGFYNRSVDHQTADLLAASVSTHYEDCPERQ